jgi:glycosyltransferase involved in cell wall biosynthesis
VVVHSEFLRRRVAQVFPGPVKKLGLPHLPDRDGPVLSRAELGIPEDRTLILTIGHVNPNKRIPSVIEALGRCRGAVYVVAGPCEDAYRETLESLVRVNGLGDSVRFTGYAPDAHLRSYLEHADLCVNLRHPVTEGASGSVIEEMLYGKPVIVTDTGFYSELPDDCVRKVNPRREREELRQALRELLHDPPARRDMGARALRYAAAEFRADAYAAGIREMAGELLYAKPLLRYADRIGAILSHMGVSADMPVIDTVGKVSADLFLGRD